MTKLTTATAKLLLLCLPTQISFDTNLLGRLRAGTEQNKALLSVFGADPGAKAGQDGAVSVGVMGPS